MKLYPTNKDLIVEIYMNLIATFSESAKNQISGYLIRQVWLDTNYKITELLVDLETKTFISGSTKATKTATASSADAEDGGDIEAFLKSSNTKLSQL